MSHARVKAGGGERTVFGRAGCGGMGGTVASMRLRRRRQQEGHGFRYSAWDGTQKGFDLDADALLDEMTDDLLYHGDLHAALRRLMQQGMQDRNGERAHGPARDAAAPPRAAARDARALRPRRRVRGDRRAAARDRRAGARGHRAPRRRRATRRTTSAARRSSKTSPSSGARSSTSCPPDLAGKVQALQQYDWMDDAARQRFEELMEKLQASSSCRAPSTRCPRACRTWTPSAWRA